MCGGRRNELYPLSVVQLVPWSYHVYNISGRLFVYSVLLYLLTSGRICMPTYISLVNLTEQGIKEVKNAPERLQAFDTAAREIGGRLVGFYLVMRQYDYVVITEAPDDQMAARLILGTIAQ